MRTRGRAKPHNQHALGRGQGNGRKPFAARQRRRHAHGAKGHGPHGRGDNLARVVLCAGKHAPQAQHGGRHKVRGGRINGQAQRIAQRRPRGRGQAVQARGGHHGAQAQRVHAAKHAAARPKEPGRQRRRAARQRPQARGAQRALRQLCRGRLAKFHAHESSPCFPCFRYIRRARRIGYLPFYDRARRPAYFVCLRRRAKDFTPARRQAVRRAALRARGVCAIMGTLL